MKLSREAAAGDVGSKRSAKQLPPSPDSGGAARGNKWRRAMVSPKPKPRRMWTAAEENALQKGVLKHGAGKWKKIHGDLELPFVRNNRSSVDLKDKWRVMVRKMTKGHGDGVSPGTVVGSAATEVSPSPCSQQGTPLPRHAQPRKKLSKAELSQGKSAPETEMLTPSGAVAGNGKRKGAGAEQGRGAADRVRGNRRVVKSERMQGAREKQQAKARRKGQGELSVKLEPAGLSPNRFVTGCADDTHTDTDSGGITQLHLEVSAANTSLAIDGQPPAGFKSVAGSSPRARSTSSSPRSSALPTAVLGSEISAEQAVKLAASRVSGPRRKFFAVQWDEPSHADHDVWYIARVARPGEGQDQPPRVGEGRADDAERSAQPSPAARASPEAIASDVSKPASQQLDLPAGWCLLEFKADFVVEEAFHLSRYAELGRVRTLKSHPANASAARAATPATGAAVGKGKSSSSAKLKARPAASAGTESGAKRAKTCTGAGQPGRAQSLRAEGVDRTGGLEAAAPTSLDLAAQLSVQLPPSPAVEQPAGRTSVGTDSLHSGHPSLTDLHLTLPDASGYVHQDASLRLDLQATAGLQGPSAAVPTESAGGAVGGGTLSVIQPGLRNGGVSDEDWLAGCDIGNNSTAVVCNPDELEMSDTVHGASGNSIGTSAASHELPGGQLDSLLQHGGETAAISFGDAVTEGGAMALELGSFGSATGAGDSADMLSLSSDVHADAHAAASAVDWS